MEILKEVGVHDDWLPMFQEDPELLDLLRSSIANVEEDLRDFDRPMIPDRSKLLLALSRCAPKDVKVVILGHEPISDTSLATGFAFSFPQGQFIDKGVGQRVFGLGQGKSVAVLHDVLVEAGYLERGANYDGCHEEWADRGVLLLNAALTYTFGILTHFDLWKDFICRLLCLVAHHSQQQPIFFLSWGTRAEVISEQLLSQLQKCGHPVQKIDDADHSIKLDGTKRLVVFIGHHPTFPKGENRFIRQATTQFKTIIERHENLFGLTIDESESTSSDEMED